MREVNDMSEVFIANFCTTLRIISGAAGILAAVAVVMMAAFVLTLILGLIFDAVTEYMAKRWERKGKLPKHTLGKIIMRHHRQGQRNAV